MVPGMSVLGMRSLAPGRRRAPRRARCPRRRRWRRCRAPGCSPGAASERLDEVDFTDLLGMADAKYAAEVAAAGGHALLLSGPKGAGKTSLAERIPTILPDLSARGVAGAHRHPLAGRRPRARRRHAHPAAVLRAAPRRQQDQPDRRRQRAGAAGRDQSGARRGAVPRRVPALPERHHRGAATAAGERRHHHRPPGGVGHACRPGACSCSPATRAPVATTQRHGGPTRAAAVAAAARLPQQDHRTDRRPHRHHPARRAAAAARAHDRFRSSRPRRWCAHGWLRRARGSTVRYAELQLAAQRHVPGPVLRERWPLPTAAQRLLDDAVYDGQLSSRGAVRVHRLAWTVADLAPRAGSGRPRAARGREVDVASACAPASRSWSRTSGTAGRMRRRRERLARAALNRLAEPGDLRLTALVAELGAVRLHALLREERDARRAARRRREPAGRRRPRARARAGRSARPPLRDPRRRRVAEPSSTTWPRRAAPRARWCAARAVGQGPAATRRARALGGRRRARGPRPPTAPRRPARSLRSPRAAGFAVVSGAAFGIDVGRPPWCAAGRRAHGGGAGLRRRPGLPRRTPRADRPLARDGRRRARRRRPGARPTGVRFLARNRLIAALTRGTVVVEAAMRSGALNTANWASRLNRVVLGVPGPVTSAPSAGRAPADPRRRRAGDRRGRRARAGRRRRASTWSRSRAAADQPRDRLTTRQHRCSTRCRCARGAGTDSIARIAGLGLSRCRRGADPAASAGAGRARPTDGWRLAALASRVSGRPGPPDSIGR